MRSNLNRLIGEEMDVYKDIYDKQLSQLKAGVSAIASQLISKSADYNYYRLVDTLGYLTNYELKHDYNSDRSHFVETSFQDISIRNKLRLPLFYTEKIRIEYLWKKDSTILFEDFIIKGFKSSAQPFLDLLNKNQQKGQIRLTLVETGDGRIAFEKKFFGDDLEIVPLLEQDAKRNLSQFLIDPTYQEGKKRLKLFFPEIDLKQIDKMDKVEPQQKINSINFKSLGIKTIDAYIHFIRTFSQYYITNTQLMKKTRQIDMFLTKYLDK